MSAVSRPRPQTWTGPLLLAGGLLAAVGLRSFAASGPTAASTGAGVLFATALLGLALAAGWRPGRPRLLAIGLGLLGAAVLVGAPILRGGGVRLTLPPTSVLTIWAPAVCLVATAEEVALRGVLYGAIEDRAGATAALLAAAALFALLHLPLYGLGAMPLDLAVGIWLGILRRIGGGVQAPAIAHSLADLAGAWIV